MWAISDSLKFKHEIKAVLLIGSEISSGEITDLVWGHPAENLSVLYNLRKDDKLFL